MKKNMPNMLSMLSWQLMVYHTPRIQKLGMISLEGISGGERKRLSIAEVTLVQASIQCWDNSTRGLDAATALEFISSLKTSASILNDTL